MTEGTLYVTVGSRKHCLQNGGTLIVNVYEYHQCIMKPETGRLTYYCLLFTEATDRAQMSMLPDMYTLIDLLLSDCLTNRAEFSQSIEFIVSVVQYIHENFKK